MTGTSECNFTPRAPTTAFQEDIGSYNPGFEWLLTNGFGAVNINESVPALMPSTNRKLGIRLHEEMLLWASERRRRCPAPAAPGGDAGHLPK